MELKELVVVDIQLLNELLVFELHLSLLVWFHLVRQLFCSCSCLSAPLRSFSFEIGSIQKLLLKYFIFIVLNQSLNYFISQLDIKIPQGQKLILILELKSHLILVEIRPLEYLCEVRFSSIQIQINFLNVVFVFWSYLILLSQLTQYHVLEFDLLLHLLRVVVGWLLNEPLTFIGP